jgi:prepilin-type N-terminal cleavage/methylation domain-containing protein
MNKKKQFTIIEMLVVLAIISLIVGMLLAGISIAKESARETKADAEMVQIQQAVAQYKSTFKDFPSSTASFNSGSAEWSTMITYLNGTANARKQSFLKGEISTTPWGGSYSITFDTDWDNQVNANGTNVADVVALWCTNKKGEQLQTWE